MPITTPETEQTFRFYSSALEVKEAAKASLVSLEGAIQNGQDLEPSLKGELENIINKIKHLFDLAQETVVRFRPTKIEDRGYSAEDRGISGFIPPKGGCGDKCGSCGTGGCGQGTP